MAESLNDDLLSELPYRFKSPQNPRPEWEGVLRKGLGRYLDRIEESIREFASARPRVLSFMAEYEKERTAEVILSGYVQDRLSSVPLHLLSVDFTQLRGEQHFVSPATEENRVELDDDMDRMDRRSVTMAAEPMTPPGAQPAAICMGPPPRPSAPMAPMTPVTPWRNGQDGPAVAGPSCKRVAPTLPVLARPSNTAAQAATGKRPVSSLGPEEQQQALPSPSKKAKTSLAGAASPSLIKVTKSVSMFDVEREEYIFRDARCEPGWYVIRCNIGETQFVNTPTRFTVHPLENNEALVHFNQRQKCHHFSTKDKYTEESILQKFAHRGM